MTIGGRGPATSPAAEPEDVGLSAETTTSAAVLAGGVWTMLARALPQVYLLVQSILLARFLSVADMGRQSFIGFIELSLIPVCTFGISAGLIRFAADAIGRGEPGTVRGLVRWCLPFHLVGAMLGAAVMLAIGLIRAELRSSWVLAGMACALGVISAVPEAVLSALQRWRDASVVTLVVGALTTAATGLVLVAGGGIASVFAVSVVMSVVALAAMAHFARRAVARTPPAPRSVDQLKLPLLRYAALVWASLFLTLIVWRRSEFFFLERHAPPTALAFYSVAFAAAAGLGGVIDALSGVVAPTVATLQGSGDHERLHSGFARAVRLVVLTSVPLAAAGIALGPATIAAIYGSSYSETATPLRIMLSVFPIVALMSMCSGILWGMGRARVWLLSFAFASVVNIALDLLIIPEYAASGAAIANSSAQVAAAVPIFLYTVRLLGGGDWYPVTLAKASGTAIVAAIAGWGLTLLVPGLAGAALGAVVAGGIFVVLAPLVRVLPPPDAAWLDGMTGHRLGGLVGRVCRSWSDGRTVATPRA